MKHSLIAVSIASIVAGSAYADDGVSAKNGSLKATQGPSEFKINGRLMFDWDNFDGAHNVGANGDNASQSEIRRARIAVTSQLNESWKAKLQVDYNDAKMEASLKDAYIQHKGQSVTWTIGKHKEPMGLEELTSSKYITTIERSMVTDAFAPSRSLGVSVRGGHDKWLWQGGIFKEGQDASNSKNETYAFTGRLVYTPVHKQGELVHLGLAVSQRDLGGNPYQFKERAEVHTADKIVTSAAIDADSMRIIGLEAATVQGPWSLQAEYYDANVSAQTGQDGAFSGYYLLGSYFLTGESRPYKHGSFGKVQPNSPDGAWELVAKYSVLDGQDNGTGVKGKNATIGVNYYLSASMRFMANYITTDLSSPQTLAEDSGNALSLRFQYIW